MTTLNEAITARIGEISADVNSRVVDHFVEREAQKRADAIIKVMDKLNSAQRELYKLRPDNTLFDEEGNVVQTAFTKPRLEERKKLVEKIDKMKNALDAAIDKGDMDKVYKIAGEN